MVWLYIITNEASLNILIMKRLSSDLFTEGSGLQYTMCWHLYNRVYIHICIFQNAYEKLANSDCLIKRKFFMTARQRKKGAIHL